jgi:hypothetical protein
MKQAGRRNLIEVRYMCEEDRAELCSRLSDEFGHDHRLKSRWGLDSPQIFATPGVVIEAFRQRQSVLTSSNAAKPRSGEKIGMRIPGGSQEGGIGYSP